MNPQQLMMIQALQQSQTPQIAAPSIPQPQMMQPQQPQAAPMSTSTAIMDGITKFVTNFRQQSDVEKQRAQTEADRDLKLLSLGVPVDQKKILKNMQRAGIQFDQAVLKGEQPWVPGGQQGPPMVTQGAPGTGPQSTPVPGPPVQQQMPAQPPPSAWDRIKQGLGMPPAANPASEAAGAQWLQQFGQQQAQMRGLQGKQLQVQNASLDNNMQQQMIIRGIMSDDPEVAGKSLELGTRFGLATSTPFEQALQIARRVPGDHKQIEAELATGYLGMILGTDKILAQHQKMAMDMKDNFGGDLGKSFRYVQDLFEKGYSDVQPSMDPKTALEIQDRALKLVEEYPGLPLNVARIYAHANANGNKELVQGIEKMLTTVGPNKEPIFKTKGQYDLAMKQEGLNNEKQRISQGWTGLGLEKQRISQQWTIFSENFRLNAANSIMNAGGKQVDDAWRMYTSDSSTTAQKNAALQTIEGVMSQMNDIEVPVGIGPDSKPQTMKFSPGKLETRDVPGLLNFLKPWELPKELISKGGDSTFSGKNPEDQQPKGLVADLFKEWMKSAKVKPEDFAHFNSTF